MGPLDSAVHDILVIFSVSTFVVILFHFLRQPALAGFLLSGALVGPHGFGWIQNMDNVNHLSEVGIVLLLFSLGVEFSLHNIKRMSLAFFGLGALQCIATTGIVIITGKALGFDWKTSFAWGSIITLSSTAVVLKVLHQRRETVTPHGQVSTAVLLFQDLWIIPLMVLFPLLSDRSELQTLDPTMILNQSLKTLGLIASVIISAKFLIPLVLRLVSKTQNRELFLMIVVALVAAASVFTEQLGLSFALGAFIAGIIISESEYGHQAVADIIPFRDIFMALFFVSAGMLLNYKYMISNLGLVLFVTTFILVLKFATTATIASVLGYPSRLAALVAVILSQVGEFSFVLAGEARRYNLITADHGQLLLCATLALMALTPVLVSLGSKYSTFLGRFDFLSRLRPKRSRGSEKIFQVSKRSPLVDHVVIIGYGHNGQTLAQVLKKTSVSFAVIEMNHNLYLLGKEQGINIEFGDASHLEILETANISTARMIVIAINDAPSVRRIARKVRRQFPSLYILARCHYIQDAESIKHLGISDIVIGEYEMSLELFARVLRQFGYSVATIEGHISDLQTQKYSSARQFLRND